MQFFSFLLAYFIFILFVHCSTKTNTFLDNPSYWLFGSDIIYNSGSYTNYGDRSIPKARRSVAAWAANSNIFMFGGRTEVDSNLIYMNDLFKISVSGEEEIDVFWLSGCAGMDSGYYPNNYNEYSYPSSRATPYTWSSPDYFYMFGGYGQSSVGNAGWLNDFFKFDINLMKYSSPSAFSKPFLWIAGCKSENSPGLFSSYNEIGVPPAMYGGATWINSAGNLFLKGGMYNSQFHDAVWMFNITSSTLIWISGCNLVNNPTNYPSNYNEIGYLGGRLWPATFLVNNTVYVFGGDSLIGLTNDLWASYDDGITWYWIAGSNTTDNTGTYNLMSPGLPSARTGFVACTISGKIFLFGGALTTLGTYSLQDWWLFDGTSEEFILLKGDNTSDTPANYPDSFGSPGSIGARFGTTLIETNGFLWLFMGYRTSYLNDIWRIPFIDSSSSKLPDTQLYFYVLSGCIIICIVFFSIYRRRLFFRFTILYSRYYLFFVIIGLLNFASDIMFLSYVANMYFFFASLIVCVLTPLLNLFIIRRWIVMLKECDNYEEIKQYILKYQTMFNLTTYFSIFLGPLFLYILKSDLDRQFRFPLDNQNVAIYYLTILHDIYSTLPQSILIYYYIFSTYQIDDISLIFLIIVLFKLMQQIIFLFRSFFILWVGGGRRQVVHELKFGVHAHRTPAPGLISLHSLSKIEVSETISDDSKGSDGFKTASSTSIDSINPISVSFYSDSESTDSSIKN